MLGAQPFHAVVPIKELVGNFAPIDAASQEVMREKANTHLSVTDRDGKDEEAPLLVKFGRTFRHDENITKRHNRPIPSISGGGFLPLFDGIATVRCRARVVVSERCSNATAFEVAA